MQSNDTPTDAINKPADSVNAGQSSEDAVESSRPSSSSILSKASADTSVGANSSSSTSHGPSYGSALTSTPANPSLHSEAAFAASTKSTRSPVVTILMDLIQLGFSAVDAARYARLDASQIATGLSFPGHLAHLDLTQIASIMQMGFSLPQAIDAVQVEMMHF